MLTKECFKNFIVCFTSTVNPLRIEAKKTLKTMGINIIEE
jgi:hypothetical protein